MKEARLQTLKSEFDALRMKADESRDQYAGKLMMMSVKFASLGGTLVDAAIVKKPFDTMSDRFITVVAGIEHLKNFMFEEAIRQLKAYEECTRRGAGSTKSDGGQLLLT